jgi:hypothetical protein
MTMLATSGRGLPGLAGGVPMGIRHAAEGIPLWPRATDAPAKTTAIVQINRLISDSCCLVPDQFTNFNIIQSAFDMAQKW